MAMRWVIGGVAASWCVLLLGVQGCSGESAVVGGNESASGDSEGSAAEQSLGKVARRIEEIRSGAGLCLPWLLPLDTDGTAACRIFTTSADASCACGSPNRAPTTAAVRAAILAKAKTDAEWGGSNAPPFDDSCVCEDLEATGKGLATCLATDEPATDGWCYVSPDQGIGTLETPCQTDVQATVRFAGSAAPTEDEHAYIVCSDAAEIDAEKRPLGAVCIPSDERDPTFSGFQPNEVVVDTASTMCASGTCVVEVFLGRVSCPLGNAFNENTCWVPGSNEPVVARVPSQLQSRPPSEGSTCSCRCDGPGDGPFCACGEGFDCVPLVADLGLPGDELAGSYCVPHGAASEHHVPGEPSCDENPDNCREDRPF